MLAIDSLSSLACEDFLIQVRHGTAKPEKIFKRLVQCNLFVTEGGPVSYCLPYSRTPLEEACLSFYRNIYETFMNFSVLQNTPLLLTKLSEDDFQDTLYFGLWPYLARERGDDERVYGLLSLHQRHYVLFQTQWRTYDQTMGGSS